MYVCVDASVTARHYTILPLPPRMWESERHGTIVVRHHFHLHYIVTITVMVCVIKVRCVCRIYHPPHLRAFQYNSNIMFYFIECPPFFSVLAAGIVTFFFLL